MSLSQDKVRDIARLARLELSDEEVKSLTPQLESILGFVEQLSQLKTDDIEPMTTALDVENQMRPDVVVLGLTPNQALSMSPRNDGEYFLVPAVLKG